VKKMLTSLCAIMMIAPTAVSAQAPEQPAATTIAPTATAQGVVRIRSLYGIDETVRRLKADIADKGIRFFTEIDQSQLGASADIAIRPSRLILFGNPPLGVQFLSSNPYSGLDWPVRMLILEEADGSVSVAWTEFGYIANRFGIKDRDAQFAMANAVATSIASSVTR
jgi:uncharacterized protein (DUF302 family)